MRVEVAFALPDRQYLESVDVPAGATVAAAIRASGLAHEFPGVEFDRLAVGVWGKVTHHDRALRDGDRVELYRPLAMDPRDVRRLKAGS